MKKFSFLAILIISSLVLTYCGHSKKATASKPKEVPKSTFDMAVSPVIMTYCTPCHVPAKGGNKKAYDNFANVKADIDDIIRRIEMNPGERGYMPFKKAKLNDSTIAVFKQWKADGMMEK